VFSRPEADPLDQDLVGLLHSRDGTETVIQVEDGRRYRLMNIAWGYDVGHHFAHITTNVSPSLEGFGVDFFYTDDMVSVEDPVTGQVVWRRTE
jgi:hypothetical protein